MNYEKLKVLIVDDDFVVRSSLEDDLKEISSIGKIVHAENGKRGLARLEQEEYDLVFLDIDLPMMSGMDVLRESIHKFPQITFILMTAYGKIPDVVEALRLGAFTYLEKPLKLKLVERLIEEVTEARDLISSVQNISPVSFEKDREMVGSTQNIQDVLSLIKRVSRVITPVLIQGESGTGKELVARAIHFNSDRKSKPFVTTNCSTIPDTLFESEFFGHEKGSFTGADQRKIGKFQYAHGGTLFLDEIGDLSLANQVKLLRVLQEKKITPLGSNIEFSYDVRVVVATHKNLEKMIEKGEFRQDLYFRLNVLSLVLPSLKDRRDDIPDLTKSFIQKFNIKHDRKVLGCKPDFIEALLNYDFPGNIRELENAIERGFVLTDGPWLDIKSLPVQILRTGENIETQEVETSVPITSRSVGELLPEIKVDSSDLDYQKNKEEFEKKFIIEALKRSKGMINQTALDANIPKKTLQRKIQKYEIDVSEYKKRK